jgi:C1A family cysteine protease
MEYKLGLLPDKFDGRDILLGAHLPRLAALPLIVDNTGKMSPVRNQRDEGSCVGFATVVGVKEYQEYFDYGEFVELSPRYLYQNCKLIDGNPNEEGTSIRSAMKVLAKKGVCEEYLWAYFANEPGKPKTGSDENAARFKIKQYGRLLDLNEIRKCIATVGVAAFGIECFSGIMKTTTGIVPMPSAFETPLGGHALCAVGYSDKEKLLYFKNSWGIEWGMSGYGRLPYKYVDKYLIDAWSSLDIDDPNPLTLSTVMCHVAKQGIV